MLTEISLSLETDILKILSGISLQHVFLCHFALQSEGEESRAFL